MRCREVSSSDGGRSMAGVAATSVSTAWTSAPPLTGPPSALPENRATRSAFTSAPEASSIATRPATSSKVALARQARSPASGRAPGAAASASARSATGVGSPRATS